MENALYHNSPMHISGEDDVMAADNVEASDLSEHAKAEGQEVSNEDSAHSGEDKHAEADIYSEQNNEN